MSSGTAWDAERYEGRHSYVWNHGAGLVELLDPRPDERILDLGCGTGHLTQEIASRGARVVGLDSAPNMIGQARQNYPRLEFALSDATDFHFPELFDAVFSNAALHWVKNAKGVAGSVAAALKTGGRFVAELGGKGNITAIQDAFRRVLESFDYHDADDRNSWYFPGIGEYSGLLEAHGLEVTYATLFDRPTPLEGEDGMEDWIEMYCGSYLQGMPAARRKQIVVAVISELRPTLYREGIWTADYRRLRVVARKEANGCI